MANEERSRIEAAAAYIGWRSALRPRVGVILGTGLGDFTAALETEAVVSTRDIPNFPVSTVESHAGELHLAGLANFNHQLRPSADDETSTSNSRVTPAGLADGLGLGSVLWRERQYAPVRGSPACCVWRST
jgi:hypothetical protein